MQVCVRVSQTRIVLSQEPDTSRNGISVFQTSARTLSWWPSSTTDVFADRFQMRIVLSSLPLATVSFSNGDQTVLNTRSRCPRSSCSALNVESVRSKTRTCRKVRGRAHAGKPSIRFRRGSRSPAGSR